MFSALAHLQVTTQTSRKGTTLAYLVLCVLTTSCFGLCYKVSSRRGCHAPMVQFSMFVSSAIISALVATFDGGLILNSRVALTGFGGGVCMSAAVYTFFAAMSQGGLAVGWTCVNFGVVVPVIASVIIWRETPSAQQLAGFALLLPCILLFADLRMQVTGDHKRWTILVVISTLLSGGSSVMVKMANDLQNHLPTEVLDAGNLILTFTTFSYGTAAVLLFLSMKRERISVWSFDAAFGLAMGLFGLVATWTLIRSLDFLPGIVVFPAKSAGGLVLTAILAVVFWRERLTKRQTCGIVIGALSAVLINW